MKMILLRSVILTVLAAGVIATSPAQTFAPIVLDFDFRNGAHGWSAFFADYPVGEDSFFQLQAGIAALPPELGAPGTGFMLSGNNHSDDLLMALKRKVDAAEGILAGRTYWVDFSVEFASEAQTGCIGVGGQPGESVWIKVGGAAIEPRAFQPPRETHHRLSVNVGNQTQPGPAASVAGNVANGVPCGSEPRRFRLVTRTKRHAFPLTANSAGELWLLVFSDSGYESVTRLYYTRIAVTLNPVETGGATRLANLSSRAETGGDAGPLFAGFVVAGTGPRELLIRGAGPALAMVGVRNFLADPLLEVFDATQRRIAANDNWNAAPDLSALRRATARTGAFAFPEGSNDAALVVTLNPGAYTATVRDAGRAAGVSLVEVFDSDVAPPGGARLVNLATRAWVRANETAHFAGLVVDGPRPEKLLLRAVGPGLSAFGVTDFLPDPQMQLWAGAQNLAENDNWDRTADGALAATAGTNVGAFALQPGSRDAALLVTLPPGVYTLHVSDVISRTGTAVIEAYRIP
jgi:hypothetical protein